MKRLLQITMVAAFALLLLPARAQVKKAGTKKQPAPVSKGNVVRKANAPKQIRVPGIRVKLTTDSGVIVLRLYDKTPKHRDNFVKLVNEHFFDSLLFHRVIKDFMIQGGDPQSKNAPAGTMLGAGDVGYTIPAEFDSTLFHKKGALAAARTDNPEKASSGCQFYIVQGRKYADFELDALQQQMGIKFSPQKRAAYKTLGGTPFLDMNYTVFGEVESGLEVIDKIASAPKGYGDRPVGDIRMYAEIIK